MSDLDQLRQWRAADPGRVLVLEGPDASRGVRLVCWQRGERLVASYGTPAAAVSALASGIVRWRTDSAPDGKLSWSREPAADPSKAKRGRPRYEGRSSRLETERKPKGGRRGGRKQRAKRERAQAREKA